MYFKICDDYSVSFTTALIFSVGIWCPEGDGTQSLLQYYVFGGGADETPTVPNLFLLEATPTHSIIIGPKSF